MWWNDKVKAGVWRKKVAWKEVLLASNEYVWALAERNRGKCA